jgi:hypothetical protein
MLDAPMVHLYFRFTTQLLVPVGTVPPHLSCGPPVMVAAYTGGVRFTT